MNELRRHLKDYRQRPSSAPPKYRPAGDTLMGSFLQMDTQYKQVEWGREIGVRTEVRLSTLNWLPSVEDRRVTDDALEVVNESTDRMFIEAMFGEFRVPIMRILKALNERDLGAARVATNALHSHMFD